MCVAHSQDTYSLCLLTVFNAAVNPRPSFLSSPRLFLFSPCKSNCGMLFTLKVWAKHPRGSRSWHPVLHRLGTAGGIAEVPTVLQYCSAFRPGVTLVQGLCRCTPVEHSYHCSLQKRKKKKKKRKALPAETKEAVVSFFEEQQQKNLAIHFQDSSSLISSRKSDTGLDIQKCWRKSLWNVTQDAEHRF